MREVIMGRVVREMGKVDDAQLAGFQESVSRLLGEFESFMGGDLVT
jgi:hypothetical protein